MASMIPVTIRKFVNPKIVPALSATVTAKRTHFQYVPDKKAPVDGATTKMNMFQAINNAMDQAMEADQSALLFGEDVAFGGVFRCSINLQKKYGPERVFNTPLCEQGIAGFAIGAANMGAKTYHLSN